MQFWVSTISGSFLLLLAAFEVFSSVLHPRAVTGPMTSIVNKSIHVLLRSRLGRIRRIAVAAGPLLVLAQILVWAGLLLFGASLIFWPQLGGGITAAGEQLPDTSFSTAVYFAGFNLTTLGIGDLVPKTAAMQWITVGVAGLGFSFFTLVLTYVMSIYSTLVGRNRIADEIHYRTGGTGESTEYLKEYLGDDKASLLNQDLFKLSSDLAVLLESHHFYPALHYFRFGESHYAMSRMLRFCFETSTCLRALVNIGCADWLISREPTNRITYASHKLLSDTLRYFVRFGTDNRHDEAMNPDEIAMHAKQAGLEFDTQRFSSEYRRLKSEWSNDLESLRACIGEQIT